MELSFDSQGYLCLLLVFYWVCSVNLTVMEKITINGSLKINYQIPLTYLVEEGRELIITHKV